MNQLSTRDATEQFFFDRRISDIRKYGSQAMSYSAIQNDIIEFRHASFEGFIPYGKVWGVDFVLSDPIVPKRDYGRATAMFLNRSKETVFCQISQDYARLLNKYDFQINGFGVEHIIKLQDFKVTWKKRKCLKSWLSKLNNLEYYVFEYDVDERRIMQINEEWLGQKGNKELTFMARPFQGIKEKDVRYFYLIKEGEVLGFCTFDPVYSKKSTGEIDYYTLQHLRVSRKAPLGSQDFLILNAIFQFKEEGLKKASLGLSPLYCRENKIFKSSLLAESIFKFMYLGNHFYNYRTIGEHKDHYKADKIQTYAAVPKNWSIKKLCGILKVNNLI